MRLVQELRAHLHYKIIIPFLLLTLLVALAGSAVSFLFIVGTAQERLNNQLAHTARAAGDSIADLERANLQFLREIAFAGPNVQTGTPAVADALADGNILGLERAIEPFFLVSTQRQGIQVDRLIVFNAAGQSVVDWEYVAEQPDTVKQIYHKPRDIGGLWFVPRLLAGQADAIGDKYAGLLDLGDSTERYVFTVAPVVKAGRVVGGVIVATRLDTLLRQLRDSSSSAIVAVYQADNGRAFASTQLPADGLQALDIPQPLVTPIRDLKVADQQGIFDTVTVNEREYQFAYAPLRIRSNVIGLISVALSSDYVISPWAAARLPLMALTIVLMLTITGLGILIARQITRPLQELVAAAQAVTGGDLRRRSKVKVADEVGVLSRSFNEMTEHLTSLYAAVRAEASQRAAIVESITDGVIVCNPAGEVLVINRAMRVLLGLEEGEHGPTRFEHVPLQPLSESALAFGEARTPDLYRLRDQVIRIFAAPVTDEDGTRLGDVYVLHDVTSEVAIDRAKTKFIATISHELRTPLTVIGGSSDLLLRGIVGPLNDDQKLLVESMRKHTQSMTTLVNNMITIAGLESGSLTFDLESVRLSKVIDAVLWSARSALATKGLEVAVRVPEDLPDVIADEHQLHNALHQLLDNARLYTDSGGITISATHQDDYVRVDVSDTGRGISPEIFEQLFMRFTRGTEGLVSADRGLGLGLTIAKLLIEHQGGALWLERTSEQGSTFSFTLPCVQANAHCDDSLLATAA